MASPDKQNARRERRGKTRNPSQSPLTITWGRQDGQIEVVQAVALDWSETGLRVLTRERLEPRAYVQLQMRQHGLVGTASVRYCERQGTRYVAGLEFAGGLKWRTPLPVPSGMAS